MNNLQRAAPRARGSVRGASLGRRVVSAVRGGARLAGAGSRRADRWAGAPGVRPRVRAGHKHAPAARAFPPGRISGVDTSEPMLAEARRRLPGVEFEQADIAQWRPRQPPDLIFADSALQWVADHETLFPRLMDHLAEGGTLAVQMPDNRQEPSHALMRLIAADGPWADRLVPIAKTRAVIATHVDYYNWLRPLSRSLEIWQTTYVHPLAGVDAVVDWFRGSALLPFLAPLTPRRARGIPARYRRELLEAYGASPTGSVLFLYPRLFILARKPGPGRERSAQARRYRCSSNGACSPAAPARRRPSPPGSCAPTAPSCARPPTRSRRRPRSKPSAAHPWASRGGLKLAAALDAFGARPRRPRLSRRRRLDGRLHRRAAGRGARSVVASTSAMASSTRGSPPIRA